MICKKNIIVSNISKNKNWISSWYVHKKEYSKLIQKDSILISYIRSFLFNNKIHTSTGLRLYRFSDIIIIDFYLFYVVFLIRKTFVTFIENINLFFLKSIFFTVNKLSFLDISSNGFYIAFKIARLIEKGLKFRSKLIKLLLKKIKKNSIGIYVQCTGRINNTNIAKIDKLYIGSISLQSINLFTSYGLVIANTAKGLQSIKVWINNY